MEESVIDDYNRLQIEVGKLESVSGFSIESLIKMFAEGYELKKIVGRRLESETHIRLWLRTRKC